MRKLLISAAVSSVVFLAVDTAHAFVYTNDNFSTTPHERPVYFTGNQTDGFSGYTETGRPFSQVPVIRDSGVRMHKFVIDQAFFYITDKGIINAPDDLTALSKYLTIAV